MSLSCCSAHRPMPGGACFTEDRCHRLALWRRWSDRPLVTFVLLNPSIANETETDHTATRLRGFSEAWGMGGFEIVNAFSVVSTDPKALIELARAGKRLTTGATDHHVRSAIRSAERVVVGWGDHLSHKLLRYRVAQLRRAFSDAVVVAHALALTKDGQPRHPLYLSKTLTPVPFDWSAIR